VALAGVSRPPVARDGSVRVVSPTQRTPPWATADSPSSPNPMTPATSPTSSISSPESTSWTGSSSLARLRPRLS